MPGKIINVMAMIDFIEDNLYERLDLDTLARAMHYSKYHMHRCFSETVGVTVHDYIKRRRLTEAARLLVFTKRPILEIALAAGYESQQAFTAIFREMYKKTPLQYREDEEFYPLQLRYVLNTSPSYHCVEGWTERITFAREAEIEQWMALVQLVVDGFPHFQEGVFEAALRTCICRGDALMLSDGALVVGVMLLDRRAGSIDFLGVHPQYRKRGIARAFLRKAEALCGPGELWITTFRQGDRADTGWRQAIKALGFTEGELLTEFGYPTQKMVLGKVEVMDMAVNPRKTGAVGQAKAAGQAGTTGQAKAAGQAGATGQAGEVGS